jgi:hypothetical protein
MWDSELWYVLEEGEKAEEEEDDDFWCVPIKHKDKTVGQCRKLATEGRDPRLDRTRGEIIELGIVRKDRS